MDDILAKAGSQAVTFAIRSGISFASGYAIKTVVKFIEKLPKDDKKKVELLYNEIQTKIAILSNSMDLIRLAAARGNTILDPSLDLVNSIQSEIEKLDSKVNLILLGYSSANEAQSVDTVLKSMNTLIGKIENSIPFLQLSISTSGIQATGMLPTLVSPGRLLQASHEINQANSSLADSSGKVGPEFDTTLYSIFYNPSRLKYVDESLTLAISWKEDFARSSAQIYKRGEFAYELEIVENFDDDRYHEDDVKPRKHTISILDIARLFFSASGKLLKLEGNSSPVLILKLHGSEDDSKWIAFGERQSIDTSDSESESDSDSESDTDSAQVSTKNTSLSLLEYLIRLLSLQTNDRKTILEATDERLALYLKDENYSLNTTYLKAKQDLKNNESLDLNSNMKRLETLTLKGDK